MMNKINLITPPDKIFNKNFKLLLIYPDKEIKNNLQTYIETWNCPLDIYLYDENSDENYEWLLTVANMCDIIIFKVDDIPLNLEKISGYIMANSKTYWLTEQMVSVYSYLSINRVYDLEFLKNLNIGEKIGKE